MKQRQTVFPDVPRDLIRSFAEEAVLIDGLKVVFDDKVGLYPAAVDVTDDGANDGPKVRADRPRRPQRGHHERWG